MAEKSISEILYASYPDCIGTLSEASASNTGSMIHSGRKVFIFDKVAEKIYGKNKPKSVDALFKDTKKLIAAEFKGGLRDKNFLPDSVIGRCEYLEEARGEYHQCNDYLKVFKRSRSAEKRENSIALYAKALDSFLILSNDLYFTKDDGLELWFIAVIDDALLPDRMDVMADILNESSGRHKKVIKDNDIINLRRSLHNLQGRGRSSGNTYLYDKVDVKTASEFEKEYGSR